MGSGGLCGCLSVWLCCCVGMVQRLEGEGGSATSFPDIDNNPEVRAQHLDLYDGVYNTVYLYLCALHVQPPILYSRE